MAFSETVTLTERVAEGPITDHLERTCPALLSVTVAPAATTRNKRTVDGASTIDEDDTINTRLRVRVVDITNIKGAHSISIELLRVHATTDLPLYSAAPTDASFNSTNSGGGGGSTADTDFSTSSSFFYQFAPVLNVPKYCTKLIVSSPRPLTGMFTISIGDDDFPQFEPKWQLVSGSLSLSASAAASAAAAVSRQPVHSMTKPSSQSLAAFDVVRYKLGLTRNTQILNRDLICGLTSIAFGAVWNVMSPKASIENGGLVYYDRLVSDRKLCVQRFAESELGEASGLLPELWGVVSEFINDIENDDDWRIVGGEEASASATAAAVGGTTVQTPKPITGDKVTHVSAPGPAAAPVPLQRPNSGQQQPQQPPPARQPQQHQQQQQQPAQNSNNRPPPQQPQPHPQRQHPNLPTHTERPQQQHYSTSPPDSDDEEDDDMSPVSPTSAPPPPPPVLPTVGNVRTPAPAVAAPVPVPVRAAAPVPAPAPPPASHIPMTEDEELAAALAQSLQES